MISLKESILKSNGAGHPSYRFTWYDENESVITILALCTDTDAMPVWDRVKVKSEYDKLDDVFKKDIRYVFNRNSKTKDSILVRILCIVLSCKNYEEIEVKLGDLIKDKSIVIDRVGSINGVDNIKINFKSTENPKWISSLSFYKHTIFEYKDYKYVK